MTKRLSGKVCGGKEIESEIIRTYIHKNYNSSEAYEGLLKCVRPDQGEIHKRKSMLGHLVKCLEVGCAENFSSPL